MKIHPDDLKLVSNFGRALWTEPAQSQVITRETVSAVSLLDGSPEHAIEKAAQALLDRATQKGMYERVPNGLSALFPEERFILLALHQGKWSYARIARVIRETTDTLQQLAWNARIYLARSHYPVAPGRSTPNCPEYDAQRPWTQRFLDQELAGRETLFLQSHVSRCESCRDALVRAKEVYYAAHRQIELELGKANSDQSVLGLTAQLQDLIDEGRRVRHPGSISASDAFRSFFARTDVRVGLAVWIGLLIYILKNS